MIKTDEQRRWWFANHPEYSSSHKGARTASQEWRKAFDQSAADEATHDKSEDPIHSFAHELELWRQAIEQDRIGLEADPHTFLDVLPYRRFVTSPRAALRDLFSNTVRDAVLVSVKGGKSKGPGEWVEVARSRLGLEHQSKMSGQSIIERDGKLYIREYRLNGTKFDDYKDGKLYEYKARQGNLLNRDKVFPDWAKAKQEARDEAQRHVKAAQGIPIIWRVGADQVKAFKDALHNIPGITIVP